MKPGRADPAAYVALRNQALNVSRKALGLPASKAPLAVITDIKIDSGFTLTTVAFDDGTASIYLSNGGGFIGGSQRHEAIRTAGLGVMKAAAATLTHMRPVKSFPLPGAGQTSFFVVTDDGVVSVSAMTTDIEHGSRHPLYALYAASQNVVTQYRLTQQQ